MTDFHMHGESLLSKWGFSDGETLYDWWWDTYDAPPDFDSDGLLYALVAAYLVPAMRAAGYEVELERIATNHNPVRARTLNGEAVDQYALHDRLDPEVSVSLTREEVEAMLTKTIILPPPRPEIS